MNSSKIKVGDWVFTSHEGNKITGFVATMPTDRVDIIVTIPKGYEPITMPISDVWTHDNVVLSPDDIPTLIELSLMLNDEEWFRKWTYELSLWKPVESFISRQ